MEYAKQPNKVRGNKIQCINYQMCPMCYGCRAYDSRLEECQICFDEGIDNTSRNFNVCNIKIHEAWKINKMITKHTIEFSKDEEVSFISKKQGGN